MIVVCNNDNGKAIVTYSESQWLDYDNGSYDKPNFSIYRLPNNLSNANISGGVFSNVDGEDITAYPWTIEMVREKAKEIIKE